MSVLLILLFLFHVKCGIVVSNPIPDVELSSSASYVVKVPMNTFTSSEGNAIKMSLETQLPSWIQVNEDTNITHVGSYDQDLPSNVRSFTVFGDYGYYCFGTGVKIINLQDKTDPTFVSVATTTSKALFSQVVGNYLYVAVFSTGLVIFDISTISNPVELGKSENLGSINRIAIDGDFVYVASGSIMYVVNCTNKTTPSVIHKIPKVGGGFSGVKVCQDHLVATDYGHAMKIYDITSNSTRYPTLLGNVSATYPGELDCNGNTVYLADGNDGAKFIDITDKNHPVVISTFNPFSVDMALNDGLNRTFLLQKSGPYGFREYETSDISSPLELNDIDTTESNRFIYQSGNYVYMMNEPNARRADLSGFGRGVFIFEIGRNLDISVSDTVVGGDSASLTVKAIDKDGNVAYDYFSIEIGNSTNQEIGSSSSLCVSFVLLFFLMFFV